MRYCSFLIVLLGLSVNLLAQQGSTCDNPIPVNASYSGSVPAAGTVYYSAWTYDLPLQVFFTPTSDDQTVRPTVEVDFTCTPGVYEDRKIDSVVHEVSEWNIEIPMRFTTDLVERNGRNDFSLTINKTYREQLARFGVTYNVQAYVKVTFPEAGGVDIKPDTAFQNCMTRAKHIELGDTIQIQPYDSTRVFIFPYTDWQNDSISFRWMGQNAAATVYIANAEECDFEPVRNNPYVWEAIVIGKDSAVNLMPADIKHAVTNNGSGGLYYGKIITKDIGNFVVEYAPRSSAMDNAILLEQGQTVNYAANDTDRIYYFPKTWQGITISTPTKHVFTMAIGDNPEFKFSNALKTIQFEGDSVNGHRLYLSDAEMEAITALASDDYVYLHFKGAGSTTITPAAWEGEDCMSQTVSLISGETYSIARNSSQVYRMKVADWKAYDMTVDWSGTAQLTMAVSDVCNPSNWNSTNDHILFYQRISRNTAKTFTPADLADIEAAEGDEYVYVRFTSTNANSLTITSAKPAEVDPVPEEPETPDNPDNPDTPDTPDTPDQPVTPVTPDDPDMPDADGYTRHQGIGVMCHGDCDIYVMVDEETDLTLYDAGGRVLRSWHQLPGAENRTVITTTIGERYTLKDSKHASISLTR